MYRNNAVDYIVNHAEDFKNDIYLMHKKFVTEYVQEMRQDRVCGDVIMICTYFDPERYMGRLPTSKWYLEI